MSAVKITGVVVRTVDYRDYDRILTLFSREKGCVTVSARGVRRTNARSRAGCQLFSVGEYLLYARGNRYYLSQADVRQSCYEIRTNPETLAHAVFFMNVIEAAISEEPNEQLFALVMRALALYCHLDTDAARITDYVLAHAMRILGFGLQLNGCVRCRTGRPAFFSVSSGGAVCADCKSHCTDARLLPPEMLGVLRALMSARAEELAALPADPKMFKDILSIMVPYAQYHLERVFKSAKLLQAFSS